MASRGPPREVGTKPNLTPWLFTRKSGVADADVAVDAVTARAGGEGGGEVVRDQVSVLVREIRVPALRRTRPALAVRIKLGSALG